MLKRTNHNLIQLLSNVTAACILLSLSTLPVFADFVSEETAIATVEGWLEQSTERLGEQFGYAVQKVTPIQDLYGEVLYYIVYIEPSGYVVVSADDMIEPIIAFTDKGLFEPHGNNPLYVLLNLDISQRKNDILNQAGRFKAETPPTHLTRHRAMKPRSKWEGLQDSYDQSERDVGRQRLLSISNIYIPPLIQSEWSQATANGQNCYNYYTPNNWPSGSVATALAQFMRYQRYPVTGVGQITNTISVNAVTQTATTRGGNGSGGAYDWSRMPLKPGSASTIYIPSKWQMIGALCYDAGVAVGTSYTPASAQASLNAATRALTNTFAFSNAVYSGFYASPGITATSFLKIINTNLLAHMPVIFGINNPGGDNHAVIADGYGYDGSTRYHHLNLGLGGTDDAWYNLPDIDGSLTAYTAISDIIYNIFPDKTGEIISGRVVDFIGKPVPWRTVTAKSQSDNSTYTGITDRQGYYGIVGAPVSTTFNLTIGTVTLTGITTGKSGNISCGNVNAADIIYTPSPYGPRVRDIPYLYPSDINNDGRTDLIYIDLQGNVFYTTDLRNWVIIGDNKFMEITDGDFDSGGIENDLAGINLNQYVAYTTDLTSWTKSGTNKLNTLVSIDFDGDGLKDDLAGINLNQYVVYTSDINSDWTKSGANKFSSLISADLTDSGTENDLVGINLNQYAVYTTNINSDWTKSGANKFSSLITADLTDSGTKNGLVGINLNQYVVYTSDINTDWIKSGSNKFLKVISADFDGDGTQDDLAGINLNQFIVYSDNATGSGDWPRLGLNKFLSIVCADFDGDGAEDDLAGINLNDHVLYAIRSDNATATTFNDWIKIDKP